MTRLPLRTRRRAVRRAIPAAAALALVSGTLIALPQLASADSGFASDDFSTSQLASRWTVTDHVGDGTAAMTGTHLSLSVPGGTSHDPWDTNRSLRVTQQVNDTDFGLHAEFDSVPTAKYQAQGILVEQDAATWLRFDVYHDGSYLRAFAAATVNGSASTQLNRKITAASTVLIEVARSGSTWTMRVAPDGNAPIVIGSFSASLNASTAGPFVSNHGSGSNIPAYTALVGYMIDPANPDAQPEPDPTPTDEPTAEPTDDPDPTPTDEPTPTPEPSSGIVADGFADGSLNTSLWSVIDPVGDAATSILDSGDSDGMLAISVPAGTPHNPWASADAARVMQDVADDDLAVEAKFGSVPDQAVQAQGLLFEASPTTFTRFGTYYDGSTLRLFASNTANGTPKTRLNQALPPVTDIYLQVERVGNTWTLRWSDDGETWTSGTTFTAALTLNRVGPYAANASGGSSPAHTALVDYVAAPGQIIDPPGGDDPTPDPTPTPTEEPTPDPTPDPDPTDPPSGPDIDVWNGTSQTFGTPALAQRWVNIMGTVGDPDHLTSLSYRLNGGPERPLNIGPDNRRLQEPGDFNADINRNDLSPGANSVVITAEYGNGHESTETVTVYLDTTGGVSLPHEADWTTATPLQEQAQPVDGSWTASNGTVRTAVPGYDRLLAIGDMGWTDYEVTVPVTRHQFGPGAYTHLSGAPMVGLGLRWRGHTYIGGEQPATDWYPVGAYAWYRFYETGARWEMYGNGNSPRKQGPRDVISFDPGDTYIMKVRVKSLASGARYSMKMWEQGTAEPAGWQATIDDDDTQDSGSVVLIAHQIDATFGAVDVRPLPG